jgi:hypothetical protein
LGAFSLSWIDALGPQDQRLLFPTPITARKGPYSVCFRTSSWTRPLTWLPNESVERMRDEATRASALTLPLMRTQTSEDCSIAKPEGQGDACA